METKRFVYTDDDASSEEIAEAGRILKDGGLVAFPTETVYGLGGDALNPGSSRKIYAAKGRPSDNPLIVHIADMESLSVIARDIPDEAYLLARAFWPGPLTMILMKTDAVPYETTGGLDTVAVRMPSDSAALALIRAAGGFVAAPSANISGRPSPTCADHVMEDMAGRIDAVIDGGKCVIGLESTIVDLTGEKPLVLRPGFIGVGELKGILPDISVDPAVSGDTDKGERPKAPGMKYRHYAPRAPLAVVEGAEEDVICLIREKISEAKRAGHRTGVLASHEHIGCYPDADAVLDAGSGDSGEETAARLFDCLRRFDDERLDELYSESFEDTELGDAIMNRLLKAAGHRVLRAEEK